MHKCIAGFPDAVGYRRADPSTRQRRSPLFAAPMQPSLSLSFSLLPPPALSRFVQPDRRWGERVEGTVRERARLPDDTPANRWRVWRGNDGLRLWFSAITIYFGRNEYAEKRNFWNFDYRSARVNGEKSGKRRLGWLLRQRRAFRWMR